MPVVEMLERGRADRARRDRDRGLHARRRRSATCCCARTSGATRCSRRLRRSSAGASGAAPAHCRRRRSRWRRTFPFGGRHAAAARFLTPTTSAASRAVPSRHQRPTAEPRASRNAASPREWTTPSRRSARVFRDAQRSRAASRRRAAGSPICAARCRTSSGRALRHGRTQVPVDSVEPAAHARHADTRPSRGRASDAAISTSRAPGCPLGQGAVDHSRASRRLGGGV